MISLAAATFLSCLFLGQCDTEPKRLPADPNRHLQPIKAETLALMAEKGMRKEDPILIRIFKEESQLEVWKRDKTGNYALLKTYAICKWSGTLGPKIKTGDRQAPEGFYTVGPSQMNPNSSYYLSFNVGFPNSFDRAHGRTGAHLMVHGACASVGCYAMTDEQIAEIYALARDALAAGQTAFQVQALPFRMTPANLARYRTSPHFAFWKSLKEGSDFFEVTKQEPKVDVCDKRYVFNAKLTDPTASFVATQPCPAYEIMTPIAVASKQKRDEEAIKTALAAPAAVEPETATAQPGAQPGATPLPAYTPIDVPLPRPAPNRPIVAAATPLPAPAAAPAYAPAEPTREEPERKGFFDRVFDRFSGTDEKAEKPAAPVTGTATITPTLAPTYVASPNTPLPPPKPGSVKPTPTSPSGTQAPTETAGADADKGGSWWQRWNPF